jgi:hypothetical protein
MVGRLHDFVRHLEAEGVGTVYLSYPWHISAATATLMDDYVAAHFPLLSVRTAGRRGSWHAYTFTLGPHVLDDLERDLARIDAGRWRIKVRYNPELYEAEREEFLLGSHRPAGGRSRCLAVLSRLDVLPSGEAVSCKFVPELTVGDLRSHEVEAVWHGRPFERVRETVERCGLMPVCAKCNLLYTRGA